MTKNDRPEPSPTTGVTKGIDWEPEDTVAFVFFVAALILSMVMIVLVVGYRLPVPF